jgi:hypothetical protein
VRPLRADAIRRAIVDFLVGPKVYDLPLADQRDLEREAVDLLGIVVAGGPDISRERDAALRDRLRLAGAQNVAEAA